MSAAANDAIAPKFLETGRYIECELIGQGGMALVIRAFDTHLQRDVAIKLLPPELRGSEEEQSRLVQEARITGRLEHPNVVPVYELGVDDRGARFLCMKLVRGETLEETLCWAGPDRLQPDLLRKLLEVLVKVCDAVAFAHGQGVLHRDLKPANVMMSNGGEVYVLDWGVAISIPRKKSGTTTRSWELPQDPFGMIVGTPLYMAPEQLLGMHDELDERADVFSLGATLYQILTGEPPHHTDSLMEIALRRATMMIRPPQALVPSLSVPADLSRITMKAMSYEPADRYASVDELKWELQRFLKGCLPERQPHCPAEHVVPAGHAISQRPQCAASDARSISQPFA
jgi:serine/threonine-protein kinase